jgi:glycosyltransferase involved in cell wall biosynthesis
LATVLVGRHYPDCFNTPRRPQAHIIVRGRIPAPFGRFWRSADNVGFWNPFGVFDLVHTFNKIPLWTNKPWMVTFESILPRTLGPKQEIMRDILRERLLSPQCKGIIAISNYAIRRTTAYLAGWDRLPELLSMIEMIPPNIQPAERVAEYSGGPLKVIFIGNHFARKGGIVALRMARLAQAAGLPIHFHLVSSMEYGAGIYTDCRDPNAYDADLEALTLENVTLHGRLSNTAVLELIAASHFVLLPTLHDTYGYSLLEGMSLGVPSLATATAAIPEFVKDGENGFLLPLENDATGDWIELSHPPLQWDILDRTYDALAEAALERLNRVLHEPKLWKSLSEGALHHIRAHHDAEIIGARLEKKYSAALDSARRLS